MPFQGSSFVAVGAAVLKGKYRPASELRPNLPSAIDDWFAKALSVDPAGRFASAREMVAAFQDLDTPGAEADAPSHEDRPSPYATTVSAPAPIVAGGTVSHVLPVAKKPDEAELVAARAQRRRRRIAVLVAAAGLATVAAVRFGPAVRVAGPVGCPPGTALIAGATFPMGSAGDGETPSDETPLHGVTVRSFCLDLTEVTVKAYTACASCERPSLTVDFEGLTPNGRSFESQFCNGPDAADHPINCIDWHQAKAYCAAQDKRLPTEAEWELAARGKEARTYPWGQAPPSGERLNACGAECSRMLTERREKVGKGPWPAMYGDDDSAPATAPVGRRPAGATPAGVLDLAGNVWEWTESPYCPYGKDDCGDSRRVLRGGGWDTTESQDVRAARRYPSAPTARGRSIGFRCAKTL
ncbi:MAG: SUMF1/EgtB/PvdO family nonheme iron enzyme [Minicystis sp.]